MFTALIRTLWTDTTEVDFDGKYYRLAGSKPGQVVPAVRELVANG